MSDSPKTTSQKFQSAGTLTAVLAAIPAIIIAWQSKDTADSARSRAQDEAEYVSIESERRDDKTYRALRRALRSQSEAIEHCQEDVDDMSEALEELYEYVSDHSHPRRGGDRAPSIKKWHPSADGPEPVGQRPLGLELPADIDDLE